MDSGLEDSIVVIDRDVSEPVTVYACWIHNDFMSIGLVWEAEGSYYNGSILHTMSGTITIEYLVVKDGIYYTEITRDMEYSWPDGSTHGGSTTDAWAYPRARALTYVGVGKVMGMSCTILTTNDGETV